MSAQPGMEDFYEDILGKAQRGLGLTNEQLAEKANLSLGALEASLAGRFEDGDCRKLAEALDLHEPALNEQGRKAWQPEDDGGLDGLAMFTTNFGSDMTVNSYLVWDPASKKAAAFDTGSDVSTMLDFAKANDLTIELILITHTHTDHIQDLARLRSESGAPAWVSRAEAQGDVTPFDEGQTFELGALRISTLQTSGHALAGMTFVVEGLARPVAIVGDAIFAASMGGGMVSYQEALETNKKIMALPAETIICPGHGPRTTVAQESVHNPFLAG